MPCADCGTYWECGPNSAELCKGGPPLIDEWVNGAFGDPSYIPDMRKAGFAVFGFPPAAEGDSSNERTWERVGSSPFNLEPTTDQESVWVLYNHQNPSEAEIVLAKTESEARNKRQNANNDQIYPREGCLVRKIPPNARGEYNLFWRRPTEEDARGPYFALAPSKSLLESWASGVNLP